LRKIINSTYVSLDGVIEAPHEWPDTGSDPDSVTIQTELLAACDTMLMGRHTYDGFAPVWPTRSGDPYSDRINSMRKYVVSTTLRDPQWNNTVVIADDPIGAIRRLKQEPGADMVQYGFGDLSHALLRHGLLDELRLWIHPLFVGTGGPRGLLYRDGGPTMFELLDTRILKNGYLIATYRPLS
jgi:dihydrofolate reductase